LSNQQADIMLQVTWLATVSRLRALLFLRICPLCESSTCLWRLAGEGDCCCIMGTVSEWQLVPSVRADGACGRFVCRLGVGLPLPGEIFILLRLKALLRLKWKYAQMRSQLVENLM